MKIDLTLQIVVAQLWFIANVLCYPSYTRNNRPEAKEGHIRSGRALTNSFMPGFGKRQGVPHENEAGDRLRPPAYGSYALGLAGSRTKATPFSMLNFGRNLPSILGDDAEGVYDKAALRAMILSYLRKTEPEMDDAMDDQILPEAWTETGDRDRTSALLEKFKLLQQRLGNQGETWGPDAYSEESLKK